MKYFILILFLFVPFVSFGATSLTLFQTLNALSVDTTLSTVSDRYWYPINANYGFSFSENVTINSITLKIKNSSTAMLTPHIETFRQFGAGTCTKNEIDGATQIDANFDGYVTFTFASPCVIPSGEKFYMSMNGEVGTSFQIYGTNSNTSGSDLRVTYGGSGTTNDTTLYHAFVGFNDDIGTNLSTHIIDFYPHEGDCIGSSCPFNTNATSTVNFSLSAYVNPDDIGIGTGIKFYLRNEDLNHLIDLPLIDDTDNIIFLDGYDAEEGIFNYSTTTVLTAGNYTVHAELTKSYLGGYILNPFSSVNQSLKHSFIVNHETALGHQTQKSLDELNEILDGYSATSTAVSASTCSPIANNVTTLYLNTDFSPIQCAVFLVVPDSGYVSSAMDNLKENVLTHFPLGYISDFVNIISTTTVGTLTAIDTDLPAGLGIGSGYHVTLDLTNVLDPILNATTTTNFMTSSASSTRTFYEITNDYWKIFVYLGTLLYIIFRIIGKGHEQPKIMKK